MDKKNKGPLADFADPITEENEDQNEDENAVDIPQDIIDKVLEDIGSLQYKDLVKRLDLIDDRLNKIMNKLGIKN